MKWIIISLVVFIFSGLPFLLYGEEITTKESQVKEGVSLPQVKKDEGISPVPKEERKQKETKKPDREAPIIIEADHIEHHKDTDTYEAWGSVKITQDEAHLESDYAILDNRSGDALATAVIDQQVHARDQRGEDFRMRQRRPPFVP